MIENQNEVEKHRLIIRNFDESLCNKANKHDVKQVEDKLLEFLEQSEFVEYKYESEVKMNEIGIKYQQLEGMINILGTQTEKDIIQAVKRASQGLQRSNNPDCFDQL